MEDGQGASILHALADAEGRCGEKENATVERGIWRAANGAHSALTAESEIDLEGVRDLLKHLQGGVIGCK